MDGSNQAVDLELIKRVRAGDGGARETLVRKYIPMVKYIIRNYYSSFLDFEDLMQEGLIGLLSAIDEYRPESTMSSSVPLPICASSYGCTTIKQSTGTNTACSMKPLRPDSSGIRRQPDHMDLVPAPFNQFDPEKMLEE